MYVSPIGLFKIILVALLVGASLLWWFQRKMSLESAECGGDQSTSSSKKKMASLIPAFLEAVGVSKSDIRTLWGQSTTGNTSNAATRIAEIRASAENRRLKSRSGNTHSVSEECAIADMDPDAAEIRLPPPHICEGEFGGGCEGDDQDFSSFNDLGDDKTDDDGDQHEDPNGFIRVEKSVDLGFEKEGQRLFEELVISNGGFKEHVSHSVKLFIPSLPTGSIHLSSLYDNHIGTKMGVVFLPHYLSSFPNSKHNSRSLYELDRERRMELLACAKNHGFVIIDVPFQIHGGAKSATEKHKIALYNYLHLSLSKYFS